jgi:hypothetical protein
MQGGRLEEFFRRRKGARSEAARPHQPLNGVPHPLIIVDDRDNRRVLQLSIHRLTKEKLHLCRARSPYNVGRDGPG